LYAENKTMQLNKKKVQSEVVSQDPVSESKPGKKRTCQKRTKEKTEGLSQIKQVKKETAKQNRPTRKVWKEVSTE